MERKLPVRGLPATIQEVNTNSYVKERGEKAGAGGRGVTKGFFVNAKRRKTVRPRDFLHKRREH